MGIPGREDGRSKDEGDEKYRTCLGEADRLAKLQHDLFRGEEQDTESRVPQAGTAGTGTQTPSPVSLRGLGQLSPVSVPPIVMKSSAKQWVRKQH